MADKKLFGYVTKSNQIIGSDSWAYGTFASNMRSDQLGTEDPKASFNMGLMDVPIAIESLTDLVKINTHHTSCCKVKANDAAGSSFNLRPTKPNPAQSQKKRTTKFFEDLNVPINETLRDVIYDFESIGFGAIEIVRENDDMNAPIKELLHIPAHTLKVHRSRKKYAQVRGAKKVWFKDIEAEFEVNSKTGQTSSSYGPDVRGNELIFFKKYTHESDFYGVPDIVPAMGSILGDYEREEFNIAFFTNAAIPAWAIFITGDYDPGPVKNDLGEIVPEDTPGAKTDFERLIESHISQLDTNPRSTMIIAIPSTLRKDGSPGKIEVTFQKLSDDVKEASFEKYRLANRDEVTEAHGVPLSRLAITTIGGLGGSTGEATDEIYKRSRIDPLQSMLTSRLNKWILSEELDVEDYEFNLPEIDTKDEAHDIKVVTPLFQMGSITPNQIISHFGKKFGIEPEELNDKDNPLNHHYIGGQSVELGLEQVVGRDNDQGQRGVAEETLAAQEQENRETPSSLEPFRQFLESSDIDPEIKAELNAALSSMGERG